MGESMKKRSTKSTRKAARIGVGEGAKARAKFRHTPEWGDWRLQVLERSKGKCDMCGMKYPPQRLQVHHRDMDKDNYEKLENLDHFSCMCSTCHKAVHQFEKKVRSRKRAYEGSPELMELVNKFFI